MPEDIQEKQEVVEEQETKEAEKPSKFPKFTFKTFFFSYLWLGVLLVIADQITKWVIYNALNGVIGSKVTVIPGFLEFRLVINSGMSYGFLSGGGAVWRVILAIVSWVASVAIAYYWLKNLKKNDIWMNVICALVFAGALGNGIDRLFYWESTTGFSGVIDFIVIYFFGPNNDPPFGVFNVADACLSVGIVVLLIVYIVRAIKSAKKKEN